MINDFYLNFTFSFGNNYEQLTTDWAVWGGDLHSNHAVLKHVTCLKKDKTLVLNRDSNNLFYASMPIMHYADIDFDLHKNSKCIACGELVPEYVKKLLILNNFDIEI
jgi:hypothetical protein